MTIIKFDSLAEEIAYLYIKKIAEIYHWNLKHNYEIIEEDYKSWIQEKLDNGEWDERDIDEYEKEGKDVSYNYLKYKLDFVLLEPRIDIEIDGESYHDRFKDMDRDNYLRGCGWTVIRIDAKSVFDKSIINILNNRFCIDLEKRQFKLLRFFNGI